MSQTTSIRLPYEVSKKLDRFSKAIDRPKTYLIKKALEEYLREYEDYLIALERLNDKIISERELKKATWAMK